MKRNRNLTGVALAIAVLLLPLDSLRAIPLPNPTAVVSGLQGEYLDGSGVLLQWRALAPSGQFNVQRSTDGVHYVTVGVVDVHGAGNAAYAYQDAEVAPGSYHYRLRQIVAEEPVGVSRVILLDVTDGMTSKNYLYASAATEVVGLTLDSDWAGEQVAVEVSSRNGRPVTTFRAPIAETVDLAVADLAPGAYTVRISNTQRTVTRHVIVR